MATRLLKCATRTSLCLDSLQARVDLSLWPDVLSDCFDFVANYQMLSLSDTSISKLRISPSDEKDMTVEELEKDPQAVELYHFVKENGNLARKIEVALTEISTVRND